MTPRVEGIVREARKLLDEDESKMNLEDNAEYQLRMCLSPERYLRLLKLGFKIPED